MTALDDDDVRSRLRLIAAIAAPVPFTLASDVHPNRAVALGAILAIAAQAIDGDLATILARLPSDSDRAG